MSVCQLSKESLACLPILLTAGCWGNGGRGRHPDLGKPQVAQGAEWSGASVLSIPRSWKKIGDC